MRRNADRKKSLINLDSGIQEKFEGKDSTARLADVFIFEEPEVRFEIYSGSVSEDLQVNDEDMECSLTGPRYQLQATQLAMFLSLDTPVSNRILIK